MFTLGFLLLLLGLTWWLRGLLRRHISQVRSWSRSLGLIVGFLFFGGLASQSPHGVLGLVVLSVGLVLHFRLQLISHGLAVGRFIIQALSVVVRFLLIAVRLRLHFLGGVLLVGIVLYSLYDTYGRDLTTLMAASPTTLRCGLAVIGFAVGFQIGLRLQHTERSSPVFFGLAGAVLGYMTAPILLNLFFLIAVVGLMAFLIYAWPTVHDSVVGFAEQSGRRFRRSSEPFAARVERLQAEHETRVAAIEKLSVTDPERAGLLNEEARRFFRSLDAATASDDQPSSAHEPPHVASWFDQPEGDTP